MLNQADVNTLFAYGPKNPSLLCHGNIPMPLHGVSPRVIYGQVWWNLRRKRAYKDANYKCQACGVPRDQAQYFPWLEAHEHYDYKPGLLVFKGVVALCNACHTFIHDGRLRLFYEKGKVSKKYFDDVTNHGNMLLASVGLKRNHDYASNVAWQDWRMEISGVSYGPSTKNQEEWQRGEWRKWRP